jgi:hypothetical protein
MLSEYFQVKVDEVYQSAGFVSVAQAPANLRPEPYIVGWNGRFTFYDMPAEEIAQHMNQWLIQENEHLKDEVEELKSTVLDYQASVAWLQGEAIAAGEEDPNEH